MDLVNHPDTLPSVGEVEPLDGDSVPSELTALRELSESWLDERVERFDPFTWETIQERELRRKTFAEASLCLLQSHETDADVALPNIHEYVVEVANTEQYHHLFRRDPSMVRLYGYPILFLQRSGNLTNEPLFEDLLTLLETDTVWGRERVAFEMMDLWHISKLAGVEPRVDPEAVLELSSLNHGIDIFDISTDDINAYTHDIMFYDALGMDIDGVAGGPTPYDLELPLTLLLFRLIGERNFDSGLEIVLCGVIEKQLPPDLIRAWCGYIKAVSDELGYVPKELSSDESKLEKATSEDPLIKKLEYLPDEHLDFLVHYHVNLVAVLTANVLIRDWDEYAAETDDRGLDDGAYDLASMQQLGDAIASLCKYDLKSAAQQLEALADEPIVEAFPEVYETAVEYLRSQQREDGHFGFWTDEKAQFTSMGYDPSTFTRKMVAPTSKICSDALDTIDQS